jgi:hypothetical protein
MPQWKVDQSMAFELLNTLEPPTHDNFHEWRWKLTNVLRCGEVYEPLFGIDPSTQKPWTRPYDDVTNDALTEEQRDERKSWDECMVTAAHWISAAAGWKSQWITEPFLTNKDPKGMLEALKDHYAPRHIGRLFQATCNLLEAERRNDETWGGFLSRIGSLRVKTQDLTPDDWTLSDQAKLVEAYALVKNCPSGHFLHANIITNPEFDFDQVERSTMNVVDINTYLSNRPSPSQAASNPSMSTSSKSGCLFCKKKGHSIEACRIMARYRDLYFQEK